MNPNIRETVKALIVGVERNGERVLNPESTFKFESGDIVWIVGDSEQIDAFLKNQHTISSNQQHPFQLISIRKALYWAQKYFEDS